MASVTTETSVKKRTEGASVNRDINCQRDVHCCGPLDTDLGKPASGVASTDLGRPASGVASTDLGRPASGVTSRAVGR